MAYSAYRCAAEISTDGTTWTLISDALLEMDAADAALMTEPNYTGGTRETAIITRGKREPVEITVRVFHRDATSEVAQTIVSRFNGASPTLALRWAPQGLGTGNRVYATSETGASTDLVFISSISYPQLSPGSAEAVAFAFTLRSPTIRTGTATGATSLAF